MREIENAMAGVVKANEPQLTRAALSTIGRAKSKFLSVTLFTDKQKPILSVPAWVPCG